jgi:membrane-anchored glycerophosphoryl diester phosphodiesterase (GDPDase)
MVEKKKIINRHLRRQFIRKVIVAVLASLIFVGLMSYAIYMEHRPASKEDVGN